MSSDFKSVEVSCALDVGTSEHHGRALPANGRETLGKPHLNNEPQLRDSQEGAGSRRDCGSPRSNHVRLCRRR